jgi:hypothetical protein
MSVIVGDAKARAAAVMKPADVYVINRENVKWLVEHFEKRRQPWPFDMVVIDELSSFKNHQSQRWKALRKVRPRIKRMLGLTGTPASNGLMDLWAEVFLIDRGERLGRFIGQYRSAFFKAGAMNPYTGVVYNYYNVLKISGLNYAGSNVSTCGSSDTSISSSLYFQWNTTGSAFTSSKYV